MSPTTLRPTTLRPTTLRPTTLLADIDRASHGRESDRQARGRCVAEGWRLLERAIAAGLTIDAVAIAQRCAERPTRDEARALDALRAAEVAIVEVEDAEIDRRIEGRTFGAMLGLVQRRRDDAATMLRAAGRLVVLERVLDPGNIGAIARSAAALGAAGLIVVDGCDPLHGKALRTSMGALWLLPVARWSGDSAALLRAGRDAGRVHVAAWLDGQRLSRWSRDAGGADARNAMLWMGSEAHGLYAATAEACDVRVRIDMPGDDGGVSVDSLSVGAAAAVLLWATQHPDG